MDRKVFRLQQIPLHLDRLDVVKLLQNALGIDASVRIHSLAQSVNVWAPSQTATLMFDSAPPPELEQRLAEGDEWTLPAANLQHSLMLDTHFRGLTALNDPADHAADCIAISGLGSHPIYSWQPRGGDRKFMWIRDRLPRDLPSVRYVLYGYDSKVGSNSFQSIRDLAIGLIEQLKAQGWTLSSCKPLLFLAHSLGGLILKEVLVVLANHPSTSPLQKAIRGAIFFGVPNLGMEQSALLSMVDGTPNQALIEDLAPDSHYLVQLHEKMTGLAYLQGVDCHWAYETRTSPTVQVTEIQQNGSAVWSRSGPEVILVTAQSATGGLLKPNEPPPSSIFPINQDHSNMVKFSENDATCAVVLGKLKSLLQPRELEEGSLTLPSLMRTGKPEPEAGPPREVDVDDLIKSLAPPELEFRLDDIEKSFENTFDWLFETPEPGFTQWLRDGTGLFWIRGKPGSGKSTLMKFISLDRRTNEYMLNWKSDHPRHHASFFFHHRGTPLQKSFEGLLRSLLAQILSQERRLGPILRSAIYIGLPSDASLLTPDFWTLSMVQAWFQYLLEQDKVPLHLTLFLDALDEYDGSKEFICDFLNQIAQVPSTSAKNVRVCFSSRPWNIFLTSFKTCAAGFQLQDFTEDDIRDYCLGSIQSHVTDDVDKLKEIIPDIVQRARGVFLWVKLVVKDLAAGLESNLQLEDLQQLLSSLPTELNEYYRGIIQRIPKAHRWTTYMLLEMVCRGLVSLTLDELMLNLNRLNQPPSRKVGQGASLKQKLQQHRSPIEDKREFIATYGGGLVEISLPLSDSSQVQLLHQTAQDFIADPGFQELVLGSRARITTENGHSFWAQSQLLGSGLKSVGLVLQIHAMFAERTTGQSLRNFVRSHILVNQTPRCRLEVMFVMRTYLRRYRAELLAEDPNLIRNSRLPLISWVCLQMFLSTPEPYQSAVEFILGQGYRVENDARCLIHVLKDEVYSRSVAILLIKQGASVNHHDLYSGLSALDMICQKLAHADKEDLIENHTVLIELIRRGASVGS